MPSPTTDRLSDIFAALADPTRRAILARLARGETNVGELAAPFAISAPAISRHLKVLEKVGLVARGKDAQWRPCQLRPAPLKEAAGWIDAYRKFWSDSFDHLEDYLADVQSTSKKGTRHVRKKR